VIDLGQVFRSHGILLAGGNGFLGKVVAGLLLDRFHDLKHLYLLIRPKSRVSARERFHSKMLASPALVPIVEKLGRAALDEKITLLEGDVSEPNCGLDSKQLAALAGEVDAIINCAGLVEFYPPLD
jgi:long-chain acyl-CoA synthetase